VTILKRNLIANFAGSGWSALLGLAVLPICLRLMGLEAYGLVGVFATLLSLLSPLEAGLGTALGRDFAGAAGRGPNETNAGVLRTLEIIHWSFAAVCGCLVWILAPLIAHHWVKPHALTASSVEAAVLIMGLVIVVQWPASLYSGGMIGLQKQVELNVINSVMGTIRSVGSVLVLMFISHSVVAYFVFQIVASALQTGTTAVVLWHHVGERPQRPYFRRQVLIRLRPFLIGMSGTSVVLLLVTQLDKAILSRMLPLAMFGYYTLAWSAASNLLRFVTPVQQAFFPQLAGAIAGDDQVRLAALYHRMTQILIVLTAPLALLVVAFSRQALYVWTGDAATAARTAPVLVLLMLGTLLNALMYPAYTAQVAAGWTRLLFTFTLFAALLLAPALVILTMRYGTVGAAMVWPALNLAFVTILVPLMHRRLLRSEMARWYRDDVIVPAAAALAVIGVARLFFPAGLDRVTVLVYLAATGVAALTATVLAASAGRVLVFEAAAAAFRRTNEKAR
jgi:O-antigen/teichoic acid export membrane protein